MKLEHALVLVLFGLSACLAALALFTIVVGPERASSLIAMAGILAGVIGGVLTLLKVVRQTSNGRRDSDDAGPS